jgi:hypothetical protein
MSESKKTTFYQYVGVAVDGASKDGFLTLRRVVSPDNYYATKALAKQAARANEDAAYFNKHAAEQHASNHPVQSLVAESKIPELAADAIAKYGKDNVQVTGDSITIIDRQMAALPQERQEEVKAQAQQIVEASRSGYAHVEGTPKAEVVTVTSTDVEAARANLKLMSEGKDPLPTRFTGSTLKEIGPNTLSVTTPKPYTTHVHATTQAKSFVGKGWELGNFAKYGAHMLRISITRCKDGQRGHVTATQRGNLYPSFVHPQEKNELAKLIKDVIVGEGM